jgi:hypothetical protein
MFMNFKTPLVLTEKVSKSREFMSEQLRERLTQLLNDIGFTVESLNGESSKELTVHARDQFYYISRITGLKKGELVVVAEPSIARSLDSAVSELDGVVIRNGKGGRYVSSSNYNKFQNKGGLEGTNEHYGAAYTLDINSDLKPVSTFFNM